MIRETVEDRIDETVSAAANWYGEHLLTPFVRVTIAVAVPPLRHALQEAISDLTPNWLEGIFK